MSGIHSAISRIPVDLRRECGARSWSECDFTIFYHKPLFSLVMGSRPPLPGVAVCHLAPRFPSPLEVCC